MKEKIKVVQYGLGPIGKRITDLLMDRTCFEIVGAIDYDPRIVGLDIGELAGLPGALGVRISDDPDKVLAESEADIVILTTTSSLEKIHPQILGILSFGVNIVSTCEELAYPSATAPELADEIDSMAGKQGATVLASGVNPGFLMDFLPLALTGINREVKRVRVERIEDAQYRRTPFQKQIGAGLTVKQFQQKVEERTLPRVGLTESSHMIAARLGWRLDKTEDLIKPVVAKKRVSTPALVIEPGRVIGLEEVERGYMGGNEVVTLLFKTTISEPSPRDSIFIEGMPNTEMTIKGGVNGDDATCAIVVNAIPVVIRAAPGLKTMEDIEPITYFM